MPPPIGLPGDAIFGPIDCNKWSPPGGWASGGCVGGGEGSIVLDQGWMYELIEAPDESLNCKGPGQNWDLGLLRSKTFAPAGQWEQFYVAPLVIPAIKSGCFIQYHRLFKDEKGTYLEFWTGDNSGWMHIFQLVPGKGALPIVASNN